MNILALDTSSQAASCAFSEDSILIGEFFNNAKITHSQTMLPMINSMLKSCNREINQADMFAVSVGPGSYTGLRIGVSIVKGFAFSNNKPCAAISSLECLAYNMIFRPGIIVPVINARRDRVFTSVFKTDGENITRVYKDTAMPILKLGELLTTIDGAENAVLVGDGSFICKEKLSDMLPDLTVAPANLLYQRAGSLCLAAEKMAETNQLIDADNLEPNYLILPQAQRELQENKLKF